MQRIAIDARSSGRAQGSGSPAVMFPSRIDSSNTMLPPTSVFARYSPSWASFCAPSTPRPAAPDAARSSSGELPPMPQVAPLPKLPPLKMPARARRKGGAARGGSVAGEPPRIAYHLAVSPPRCRGLCIRPWHGHPVYKIALRAANAQVSQFLPKTLAPFADAAKSWGAWFKRDLLFTKPFVLLLGGRNFGAFEAAGAITEAGLIKVLGAYNGKSDKRHNIVITSEALLLARNAVHWTTMDWLMSKHLFVCGQAPDVRFAGEIWKDKRNRVHLSANSGTYKPSAEALDGALRLMRARFAGLDIVASSIPAAR